MQVRIYMPTKTPTQSAHGTNSWVLEFVKQVNGKFIENFMGRTASTDMSNEIRLKFPTLEQAIEFAQKENYEFEVIKPKKPKLLKKSYSNNFK